MDPGVVSRVGKNGSEGFQQRATEALGCLKTSSTIHSDWTHCQRQASVALLS